MTVELRMVGFCKEVVLKQRWRMRRRRMRAAEGIDGCCIDRAYVRERTDRWK